MLPTSNKSEGFKFQEPSSPTERTSSRCSSRPRPTFIEEATTYSTKKERRIPRPRPPPPAHPQVKAASVSRIFHKRKLPFGHAQNVTFQDSSAPDSLLEVPLPNTRVYDSAKKVSYFKQAFTVESKIGAGCFGNVYRVRSKDDGKLFAVKIARDRYRGISDRREKLEEVRKHEFLPHHSNCVQFFQSWEENDRLYQQFELCRTSLGQLSDEKHDLPEKLIWAYLVDLLLAVEHLHAHNLIHMDIKPDNIFIGMDGICKLGDFGLVIDLAKSDNNFCEGDSRYLAAEVLHERKFTKAADIFALGASILELATDLDMPKQGQLWHDLRQLGPDPKLTSHLSPELRRVIQLMLTNDYQQRPTANQLLALPSVQKAMRKRSRQLYLKSWLDWAKSLFSPVTLLFISVLTFIVSPMLRCFKGIRRFVWRDSRQSTPEHMVKKSNDDDVTPSVSKSLINFVTSTVKKEEDSSDPLLTSGLVLFSEDESDSHDEGSNSSQLASKLPYTDSSDKEEFSIPMRKFTKLDFEDSSPLKRRHRPINDLVRTTPGRLLKRESRILALNTPKKKLDFELDDDDLDDLDSSEQEFHPNFAPDTSFGFSSSQNFLENDSDPILPVTPQNLLTRFDCFSDSDEEKL